MAHKTGISIIFFICMMSFGSHAQEWNIPDDHESLVNPVEFSKSNIDLGKDLYLKNCKSCHGDPGKNNGLALEPPPPDITSDQTQSNTDGELYYKLLNGKGAMPQFKTILSETEIWNVVNYIRSFNDDYVPATPSVEEETEIAEVSKVQIRLSIVDSTHQVMAKVSATDSTGKNGPLTGVAVNFFVERYFGKLPVGEGIKTDDDGIATLEFPHDLPGDTNGFVDLVVMLKDEERFGEVKAFEKAKLAKPTIPIDIFEKRHLWAMNHQTPWWIIITYLAVVIGVWTTILYVVSQILRISKLKKA